MVIKKGLRFLSLMLVLQMLCSCITFARAAAIPNTGNPQYVSSFAEFKSALANITSDTTIYLLQSIDLEEDVEIDSDYAITITGDETVVLSNYSYNFFKIYSHVVFENLTLDCTHIQPESGSELDMIGTTALGGDEALWVEGGTLNIYDASFEVSDDMGDSLFAENCVINFYPTQDLYIENMFFGDDVEIHVPKQDGVSINSVKLNNINILSKLPYTADGWEFYSILIQVQKDNDPPPAEYTIDTSAVSFFSTLTVDGVAADQNGAKATEGQEVKITLAVPNDYELAQYACTDKDGNPVEVKESGGVLTFTMPESNVTVSATAQRVYQLAVAEGTSGTFTFKVGSTTRNTAPEGATVTVSLTPPSNHVLTKLSYTAGDGSSGDITDTMQFTMPAADVEVSAEYDVQAQRRVVCLDSEGGSVSANKELVTSGWVYVYPEPSEGYRIHSVQYSLDDGTTWDYVFHTYGMGIREFFFEVPSSSNSCDILVKASFANDTELSIYTEQDLRDLAESVNNGDWHEGVTVTLENDIELHGEWTPIGTDSGDARLYAAFAGTFEGGGHTVRNLSINSTEHSLGFFGIVFDSTIRDLTVEGKIISTGGVSSDIGGIAASTNSLGKMNVISGCVSRVDIDVNMGSASYIGGIAGIGYDVEISDCVNWGNFNIVTKLKDGYYIGHVGGITGYLTHYSSLLSRCVNYGNMTCDAGEYSLTSSTTGVTMGERGLLGVFGGITGYVFGNGTITIEDCVNRGSITGDMCGAAGIVGSQINSGSFRPVNIVNCYNTGDFSSTGDHNYNAAVGRMGGLLSQADSQSTVYNSYSTGAVTVEVPAVDIGKGVYRGELWTTINVLPRSENCYGPTAIAALENGLTPAILNPSNTTVTWNGETVPIWKEDLATDANGNSVHINGGTPMLYWESTLFTGETGTVTFKTTPAGAGVSVYAGSDMDESSRQTPNANGTYTLYDGLTYYYKVSAQGYASTTGSFTVNGNTTVTVALKAASVVTFKVTPSTAEMTVSGGNDVAYDSRTVSGNTVTYVYTLVTGSHYFYSADADGYAGTTREFTANGTTTISLALESSNYGSSTSGEPVKYIYGDGNPGEEHEITTSGTYSIGEGATGTITIQASGPVTLIGRGTRVGQQFQNLYINCAAGTNLTLEQVYISNSSGAASMIEFTGTGNMLTFSGTNILDQNTGATGYAMIHVDPYTSLTLMGSKTSAAYLYKREQGAGIGGHGNGGNLVPEYNGDITISGLNLFIKGSKQGALIGGGAGVGKASTIGTPGSIQILNGSDLNLIANAQGAAIGSGSGSENSIGPNVTVRDSNININVNFDAAAIGGGGYKVNKDDDVGANESDGGTLTYEGNSSIRAYIGQNAVASWGVDKRGVNGNLAVTADVMNRNGKALYLLELDTSNLPGSSFVIKDENGTEIYSGGLHRWGYTNESRTQDTEQDVTYTIDNWVPSVDPHLYLYLTGEPHKLTVGTATVDVTWNGNAFAYEIKNASGAVIGSGGASGETDAETDETGETEETGVPAATTVSEGTAITKVDSDTLAAQLESADTNTQIVIKPDIPAEEEISKAITILVPDDIAAIADAKASLMVSTPLADITLFHAALQDVVAGLGQEAEQVTITAAVTEYGTRIEIAADEEVMEKVDGGLKVTLPVAEEELSAGCVMVLVDAEGSETILKKSALNEAGVTALLDGSCTVKVIDNAVTFSDTTGYWASEAIDFVSSRELFHGTAPDIFDPGSSMTRSMLVTVLYRLEDTPDLTVAASFGDVPSGVWYTDSVHWAAENGIVNGYSTGVFAPDDSITREQMVVMMYRYSGFLGLDVSERDDLGAFQGTGEISSWAIEAMQWAVSAGLVEGREDGALDPQGTATRAEVAAILQRFISWLVK